MSELRKLTFFLFLINGAGYLVFVDQHYNDGGWYVWIKYFILVALSFALILGALLKSSFSVNREAIFLFGFLAAIFFIPIFLGAGFFRALQYMVPLSSILLFSSWQDSLSRTSWWLIVFVIIVGAFYEYFWIGGFDRFHPNGFRGVSVLVNPNNLGITTVLLSAVAILKKYGDKFVILAFALTVVVYSGSKTALVMWIFVFFYFFGLKFFLGALLLTFFLSIVVFSMFDPVSEFSKFYFYDLRSIMIRAEYSSEFFSRVDNFLIPSLDQSVYYVDNAYLQLWIDLGFLSSFFLFLYVIFLVFFASGYRLLFLLFFMASMTTNIFYISPVAYLFWITVSDYIFAKRKVGFRF